jgi:hypothetical protein
MNIEIRQMCLDHFNEPIITGPNEISRLIGYAEDDIDCYLIIKNSRGIIWHTAVGGYIFLDKLKDQDIVVAKNGEHWDDFTRLDSWLELNGCLKEETFIETIT